MATSTHCGRVAGAAAALALALGACGGDDPEPVVAADVPRRFEHAGDGVVRDASTRLDWTRTEAGPGVEWQAADLHCRSLELDARTGWRLPEIDELSALYDESQEQSCGDGPPCRLDAAFELSLPFVWSATQGQGKRRFYIDFRFGTRLTPLPRPGLTRRVLCVRQDGDSE